MTAIGVLATAIVIISAVAMWWLRRQQVAHRPRGGTALADATRRQLTALYAAVKRNVDEPSWSPSSVASAHGTAAGVEAALKREQCAEALALAEHAVAAAPRDPQAILLLAWAAVVGGHANAAGAAVYKLQAAGQLEALGPLGGYVAARARHLVFEQRAGATEAVPPLITAGDVAVVALARGQGGPMWMVGEVELGLDGDQARAAINEHRLETLACLQQVLDAATAEPTFVDAVYWVARLAIKAGLVDDGKALLTLIAPRMVGRPDAAAFARDLAALADPTAAFAAATKPPPPVPAEPPPLARGKRSKSLRVL
ncbi:MAG TPA: hypothetical protein PLF40_11310 [Kofleriaceae bacterium]|nr:hypothetical protein [Kofleriaceae bacterium]